MIFETGNLRIRKLSDKDANYLVEWLSNPLQGLGLDLLDEQMIDRYAEFYRSYSEKK